MKRYFDIEKDKITLEINVNEVGMKYSVKEVEQAIKISGLREITKDEFLKLTNLYTKIDS